MRDSCGNEFVYQIDYGAKRIATMSIEFAANEDRRDFEFDASVNVNFLCGSASFSGGIDIMARKMGKPYFLNGVTWPTHPFLMPAHHVLELS